MNVSRTWGTQHVCCVLLAVLFSISNREAPKVSRFMSKPKCQLAQPGRFDQELSQRVFSQPPVGFMGECTHASVPPFQPSSMDSSSIPFCLGAGPTKYDLTLNMVSILVPPGRHFAAGPGGGAAISTLALAIAKKLPGLESMVEARSRAV